MPRLPRRDFEVGPVLDTRRQEIIVRDAVDVEAEPDGAGEDEGREAAPVVGDEPADDPGARPERCDVNLDAGDRIAAGLFADGPLDPDAAADGDLHVCLRPPRMLAFGSFSTT